MLHPSSPPPVLSLSELTAGIARVIGQNFANSFWVRAEMAKLNHYPESGHCYPALVEKDKGVVKAEMRGTIWANDYQRINLKFLQVTREPLKEGIHILFRAMVKYHPVYGLSLQISDIDPTYTLGEMAREKLETINKLKLEGKFDLNRSLPLPLLPKRIAIISVKTSKGYSDFINILEKNAWGYAFSCVLFPALLQGDKAVDSIIGQLKAILRWRDHFDAVAIIRGGGGDVGLNCYDNYALADEVARFPLPVLSGIGHSTNETVVEMVAGRNLITPTDLAYFLVQQFHNFSARLQEMGSKITGFASALVGEEKKRQGELTRLLMQDTRLLIGDGRNSLDRNIQGLVRSSKENLHQEKILLHGMESRFRARPLQTLQSGAGQLERQVYLLGVRSKQLIATQKMRLGQTVGQVRILDPVNVLKRGYSITYANGKALRFADELEPGDEITTRLFNGTVKSEVKSKSK